VKAVFVTGTDTGCGKTAVGCALARSLRASGRRVRVLKPIETGCAPLPVDALALAEAAGDDAPLERLCPYRLPLPAAPEVAARAEGVKLELAPIRAALARARADADLVIVEGAGGLLVPIAPGLDMAGLAGALKLPVLVAARATLGTINHTRLTLEAAAARGLRVVGLVVSHTTPDLSPADRRNLDLLLEGLPVRFLGELGHGEAQLPRSFDAAAFLSSLVPV
jgi:dethiobiotin synthetase